MHTAHSNTVYRSVHLVILSYTYGVCIKIAIHTHYLTCACADLESFARGSLTLTTLFLFFKVYEGREDPQIPIRVGIIGPPAKRH